MKSDFVFLINCSAKIPEILKVIFLTFSFVFLIISCRIPTFICDPNDRIMDPIPSIFSAEYFKEKIEGIVGGCNVHLEVFGVFVFRFD